ncbi:hypothetical protein SAMN04488005_0516 [Yoonia tamlensis]|uniref:Uncharacterized protein n=1 Tax=Yoonia tamlensis TaxID=390270 RepID=A0A1I6FUK0_9RHOB|nr:hypothetical protein [Yoonia tamlensis]SFR33566.1 hypothetical protein SAMN04488005_0516 [Yoonia tamlensis]
MIEVDFRAHGIWTNLATVEETLNNFSEKEKQDPRHREFCDKAEYVRWILEASSSSYLSSNELQQTAGELTQISNHLRNNAANFGHYDQISNYFATIFARFPYPRVKKIFRSESNEVIEDFRSTVFEIKQDLIVTTDAAQKTVSDTHEQVSKLQAEAEGLESTLGDLEHKIEAQIVNLEANVNATVTDKLTEFSRVFSDDQNKRSAEFQATENHLQELVSHMKSEAGKINRTVTEVRSVVTKELGDARTEFDTKANDIIDDLNSLYDTAGQTALAAGFAGSAKEESVLFTRYSVLAAAIFMIVAIISACMWFSLSKTNNFTFADMLMRLPVSAVLLVPGLYLASLANKHRRSAVKLRSLSLRIKAFDAYLANAPLEQRHELRSELVREFFEEQPEIQSRPSLMGGGRENSGLVSLLEKAIDRLGDIKS